MLVQTKENSSFTYLLIFATNNDTLITWTVGHNTIRHNTIRYNTKQFNTIQYNTIRYNTIQYNTVQYSTRQLAGTPQQLKPITVGPFRVYTYNYIQISGMFRNNR